MSHSLAVRIERIRSKLASYLAKDISLRAFWQWFIPYAWDIDHKAPPRLRELVYTIKLRVDDYSNGGISEGQLRKELLPLVTSIVIGEREPPGVGGPPKTASSSTLPQIRALSAPSYLVHPVARKQAAVVCG